MTLLTSVTIGITVFGERLQHGDGRLAVVAAGLALVLVGVTMVARGPVAEAAAVR